MMIRLLTIGRRDDDLLGFSQQLKHKPSPNADNAIHIRNKI